MQKQPAAGGASDRQSSDNPAPAVPPPSRRGSSLWRLGRSVGFIYIVVLAAMFVLQRKLQYFPHRSEATIPPGARYRDVQDIDLVASDGVRLKAWYWRGSKPTTVVLFHGNAGHREHRLPWLDRFHDEGYSVFALDYRGYGGSEGSPTEVGLLADARAALDWLKSAGITEHVYFGESIGCGVAVKIAAERPPRALVLQSAFSSAADIAQRQYWFLPVKLLMLDRFDCLDSVKKISAPLLAIHGESDRTIPIDLGRRLFESAPGPKEWLAVPGADHNDFPFVDARRYWQTIFRFLDRLERKEDVRPEAPKSG